MLYNRATSPRQPGSSIKPPSVYTSALQQGADAAAKNEPMTFKELDRNQRTYAYGKYWTAASGINDAPLIVNGKQWPKNAYIGFRGMMSMRKAVEQSVNVCAVRVFQQVGEEYAANQLKKFGITTVVTDTDNPTNDMNAAALALGGMTRGVSPLEMASAYGTFPNGGYHINYIPYSTVEDRNGVVILQNRKKGKQVIDPGVAFITGDMLRTTVTRGLGRPAAASGQITAGKTGTTSENYDAWFCGYTPQYSAALWIGNDVNLELTEGSNAAARLWGQIMRQATLGLPAEAIVMPSSVWRVGNEYFIRGTETYARYDVIPKTEEEKKKEEEEKKKKEEAAAQQNGGTTTTPTQPQDGGQAPAPQQGGEVVNQIQQNTQTSPGY